MLYKLVPHQGLSIPEENGTLPKCTSTPRVSRFDLDLVEVDAAITLENEVFDKELENKSSIRYQVMEKKVKQEVRGKRLR